MGRLRRFLPTYAVGLVAGLIALPGACSVGVVAWALSADDALTPSQNFLLGTAAGVVAWLILAVPLRRLASPKYANSGVYRELFARHKELARVAETIDDDGSEAFGILQTSLETVETSLAEDGSGGNGTAWAGGAAYVVVYNFIHRAEQALTKLLPEQEVVQQALYELAALRGSTIADRRTHTDRLEPAIRALGGSDYLAGPARLAVPADTGLALPEAPETAGTEARPPDALTTGVPRDKILARGIVQDAQATVDDFRDSRRRGLVRARNRLFATVVFTGMVAYGGLGLALLANAGTTQIIAGGTFYLIGASVGLFRQLSQAAQADTVTEEDFGLGMVRLVHTPLASGLAAIGGVVLTAYVTALNSSTAVPPLTEVFDIGANPVSLVSAAVFGFTPTLLSSSLQNRADQWKEELKSSTPGEKAEA